ncbi:hypothetical protein L204_102047 [Cryptococcus depauperatus]|nr:hypothetical protein L204_04531 [Cryptococcus depauperatus CBS 7855]
MPPGNRAAVSSSTTSTGSRKRSTVPKRNAIACLRCKERKARCVPAPPGSSPVPTCTNCLGARKECVYLDRTPNEIFLLEYVSQLESRCAALEKELRKLNPKSQFVTDHIQASAEAREAAVVKLNNAYAPDFKPESRTSTDQAQISSAEAIPQGDSSSATGAAGSGGQAQAITPLMQVNEAVTTKPQDAGKIEGMLPSEEEGGDGDEDDFALGMGMLSLGGGEEPVYVGPSSGVNWARVCATALRRPRDRSQPSYLSRFSYLAPPELASVQSALEYTLHHPTPPLPAPALAAHYLDLVYDHIQSRFGCFDWHTVRYWHNNREAICQGRPLWGVGAGEDERRNLAAFFLWLCYGYGARLGEDEKLPGAVSHEVYYNAAVACLSTLSSHHSLATVQALVLLTIYGFRHPTAEVSVWQVGGLSMRTAVELGLHRKTMSKAEREKDPKRYEMKKRVFWAIYSLDRMMSAQLGRPTGIQDRDIDIELPVNVDADFSNLQTLRIMQNQQLEAMTGKRPGDEYAHGYGNVTSMTSAIHNIRLNQLKQKIQDAIYRLDKPVKLSKDIYSPECQTIPKVDNILVQLDQWRAYHPNSLPGVNVPMLSREHWELEYHNCVQMLLRPIIANKKAGRRYVSLCLESAVALCETQNTYLQPPISSSKLSTWRFYRIFLAGMTLLHIITTFSTEISVVEQHHAENAIHLCQDSLSIWGDCFKAAKRHEKLFQELVGAWQARKLYETTNFADKAFSGQSVFNDSSSQHAKPSDHTASPHSFQQKDIQPPVDIMSQFLNMVNFAQSTPTRPEQLGGQEPPAPMQALYGTDISCMGGMGVKESECFAQQKKAHGFARQVVDSNLLTSNIDFAQDSEDNRESAVDDRGDVHNARWTSDLLPDTHIMHPREDNYGIRNDLYSLVTSFGIDTDTPMPLQGVEDSNLTLGMPFFQPSAHHGYWSSSAWDNVPLGSTRRRDDLETMDFFGMSNSPILGRGMDAVTDPNMGMSDWTLFDKPLNPSTNTVIRANDGEANTNGNRQRVSHQVYQVI